MINTAYEKKKNTVFEILHLDQLYLNGLCSLDFIYQLRARRAFIAVQSCSVQNQKGTISIDFVQQ